MDARCRQQGVMMIVLDARQTLGELALVLIVDDRDRRRSDSIEMLKRVTPAIAGVVQPIARHALPGENMPC